MNEKMTYALYGDDSFVAPTPEALRAGPLTLLYDNGDLRRIRIGKTELISRIYAALRRDDWGTPPAVRTEIERIIGEDSFRIVYDARHSDAASGLDFQWRGTLIGTADGTITFDFEGEALSTFRRNRIGICVLHPASQAGAACTIRHTDGAEESGIFPDTIAPHQPFFDIAALTFDAADGATATLEFSGDVFETEDQRNWLDASYKTYSTPLSIPYPVEVPAGTRIRQTVRFGLRASGFGLRGGEGNAPLTVTVTQEKAGRFPGFGLTLPGLAVPSAVKQRVGAVRFDHFRAEIDAAQSNWPETLASGIRQAKRLDAPLMVAVKNAALLTGPIAEADAVVDWLLVAPTPEAINAARTALPDGARIGGAWPGNFVDLNRDRDSVAGLDTLSYAANPQIHAFDNASVMETPPILLETQRTARTFADSKPLMIGPLTLYGPYYPDDVRQKSLFGAAWYLAALSYAAQSGAERITLCEPAGPRGILDKDGTVYPIYGLLSAVGTTTGGIALKADMSDATSVAALVILSEEGDWLDVFVANLTAQEQEITVRGLLGDSARVRILDETTAPAFGDSRAIPAADKKLTLTLRPFSIAQVITGAGIV